MPGGASFCSRWERELKKAHAKLAKQQQLRPANTDKAEHWMICAETLKTNSNISRGQLSWLLIFDPSLQNRDSA